MKRCCRSWVDAEEKAADDSYVFDEESKRPAMVSLRSCVFETSTARLLRSYVAALTEHERGRKQVTVIRDLIQQEVCSKSGDKWIARAVVYRDKPTLESDRATWLGEGTDPSERHMKSDLFAAFEDGFSNQCHDVLDDESLALFTSQLVFGVIEAVVKGVLSDPRVCMVTLKKTGRLQVWAGAVCNFDSLKDLVDFSPRAASALGCVFESLNGGLGGLFSDRARSLLTHVLLPVTTALNKARGSFSLGPDDAAPPARPGVPVFFQFQA